MIPLSPTHEYSPPSQTDRELYEPTSKPGHRPLPASLCVPGQSVFAIARSWCSSELSAMAPFKSWLARLAAEKSRSAPAEKGKMGGTARARSEIRVRILSEEEPQGHHEFLSTQVLRTTQSKRDGQVSTQPTLSSAGLLLNSL